MRTFEEISNKCNKEGEEKVRKLLVEKMTFAHNEEPLVEEWLRRKDEERTNASASKRDEREEETLSIAKEANRIASNAFEEAKRANRSRWKDRTITIIAIIIATIAAREDIMWLISCLLKKIN